MPVSLVLVARKVSFHYMLKSDSITLAVIYVLFKAHPVQLVIRETRERRVSPDFLVFQVSRAPKETLDHLVLLV